MLTWRVIFLDEWKIIVGTFFKSFVEGGVNITSICRSVSGWLFLRRFRSLATCYYLYSKVVYTAYDEFVILVYTI